ncbi:MAG: hypothetical protein J6M02_00030 [Clostridia bacterium]|nr:hypothetical protein [Clostridia bacterium]
MKKFVAILFSIFLYTGTAFANDKIALMYNIIPDDDSKKNSVIDSNVQKKLSFKLYQNQETIYFNDKEVVVTNGKFDIDISNLTGKQEIKFTNAQKEEATFTYYISDKSGLVKGYMLENKQAYVKTVDNTKILYTAKDAAKMNYISKLITNMPTETKVNLKEMKLLPVNHSSGAAGITDYNKVTLYNLSTYTDKEIQRIVTHEIAHTWAHELRKNKVIDYSYSDFGTAVKVDNNYVTNYSKNSLSEDFADSIASYLADSVSFAKKFPARADYISTLL